MDFLVDLIFGGWRPRSDAMEHAKYIHPATQSKLLDGRSDFAGRAKIAG